MRERERKAIQGKGSIDRKKDYRETDTERERERRQTEKILEKKSRHIQKERPEMKISKEREIDRQRARQKQ